MRPQDSSFNMPNILWICTEHQRWDTINCLGNDVIHTPNLDRLTKNGTAFTCAYSQSSVCTPSRASFLTGRYPVTTRCRQNGQDIPETETLVTKYLSELGYDCGLVGKLHVRHAHRGFEERTDDGYRFFKWSHGCREKYGGDWIEWLGEQNLSYNDIYGKSNVVLSYLVKDEEHHQTKWCIDRAVEFVEQERNGPWLLSLNPFSVHDPYEYVQEDFDSYDMDLVGPPCFVEEELDRKPLSQKEEYLHCRSGPNLADVCANLSNRQLTEMKTAYYAAITFMDRQIGRLLDRLEQAGELENTLIVFHSDHGDMMGDHGLLRKGAALYDPVVRVPLVFSLPGRIPVGKTSGAIAGLIDIVPTICDLLGVDGPPGMQGRSLLPVITGKKPDEEHREGIYAEFYNSVARVLDDGRKQRLYMTMWRDHRYKIIVHHNEDIGELYDMRADPRESNNLWDNPAYVNIRMNMLETCFNESVFAMDPLPVKHAPF